MIFIKTNQEGKVMLQHFKPSLLDDSVKNQGVLLEELPEEPEVKEGKIAVLYYNEDDGAYYEIEDISKEPQEQRIEELEDVVADLTELILMGGM